MKWLLISISLFFAVGRIFSIFPEGHADRSFQAFAHLFVGGLWTIPIYLGYRNEWRFRYQEVKFLLWTAGLLTGVEVVMAAITVLHKFGYL